MRVNRFVTHARKAVGPIRIKHLVETSDYQVKVLLQALFEGKSELTALVVECCDVLDIDYRWLLRSQQFEAAYPVNAASRQMLRDSIVFLVQSLWQSPPKSRVYRLAVNSLLELPFVQDSAFAVQLSRDFYSAVVMPLSAEFLMDTATYARSDAIEVTSLMEIWARVDTETFSPTEGMVLNAYLQRLNQEGIKPEQVQLCIQLAKVLLITVRGKLPKNGTTYRRAAESIKEGMTNPALVKQFLTVMRQFYPFWQLV